MAASWLTEKVIANPMSIYPEYAERRGSWYGRMSAGLVRVVVSDGTEGLGFIGSAGRPPRGPPTSPSGST